ncbi:hypothetical protein J6590_040168 [Homalodisca vitripennis]|nr:hypothetical protein J6590_040168 [Homalodisca vitripennis]
MCDKCGECDLDISQTKCPDCNIMFHWKRLNPGFAESGKKVTRKNAKCDGTANQKELKDQLAALNLQMCDIQHHTRKNNIFIMGVPVTPQGDCLATLYSMARALDIPFLIPEISIAHRLSSREGDTRPLIIVVSFVSRAAKAVWLEARRRVKKPYARDLHPSFPDHQVYMNDHLTSHTRAVFKGARELMKAGKLSPVWTSDGRTLAKKHEGGNPSASYTNNIWKY